MANGRLADKVVLLTGVGSGMGRVTAKLFASEGARVVGCDLDETSSAQTVAEVREAGFEMEAVAPIELTDRSQITKWLDHAVSAHGGIDVLYNNASLPKFAPFAEMRPDDYRFTVANELDLLWHACQLAWPHLAKRNGAIVNVGSLGGIVGVRDLPQAAHSAAKGAVIALTRQLAAEGAKEGIRVNCVSPGTIMTPPVVHILEEFGEDGPLSDLQKRSFNGKFGEPIDVAYAGLYLASDESRWVTGTNLVVDGGTTVLI